MFRLIFAPFFWFIKTIIVVGCVLWVSQIKWGEETLGAHFKGITQSVLGLKPKSVVAPVTASLQQAAPQAIQSVKRTASKVNKVIKKSKVLEAVEEEVTEKDRYLLKKLLK